MVKIKGKNIRKEIDPTKLRIENVSEKLYKNFRTKEPFMKEELIKPLFTLNEDFITLYYTAWSLAYSHVLYREDAPQPWYIDEAMKPERIWIWDTCFMALYCRYAPHQFPGIESLNNFYYIMYDGKKAPFRIHHPDNPPLFAWVEWEYMKLTGDVQRIKEILLDKEYLIKHFDFIENARRKRYYMYAGIPLYAQKTPYGFRWSGVASGMDNTPRGRYKYSRILWLDLSAQQALSAYYILRMTSVLRSYCKDLTKDEYKKIAKIEERFKKEYENYKTLLNTHYWDESSGFYYDISRFRPQKKIKVITPASFWPVLAHVSKEEYIEEMIKKLEDPDILGGKFPLPSVARNDPEFDPYGQYWRGGIWLPTSYMVIKAVERKGYKKLAEELSFNLLQHMLKTYKEFKPSTIWEAYSPTQHTPSTYKRNARWVRPDFCGWSALGPISLFIENIIGIEDINALTGRITWYVHLKTYARSQANNEKEDDKIKIGLENLKFGYMREKGEKMERYTHPKYDLDLYLEIPREYLEMVQAGNKKQLIGKKILLHVNNRSEERTELLLSGDVRGTYPLRSGTQEIEVTITDIE